MPEPATTLPKLLTLGTTDAEPLATIDVTPEPGDEWAGGDLHRTGGNLYLYVDGVELGSLWITFAADGTPKATLGQYDPETQDWEERSSISPLPGPTSPTRNIPKLFGE